MNKILGTVVIAAAMLAVSPVFAKDKSGDMACCAKTASGQSCLNLATLNLNAGQKAKLEAWQAECMKAGCTKESRANFMKQAKGILSAVQFAKLKEQCRKSAKKSEA